MHIFCAFFLIVDNVFVAVLYIIEASGDGKNCIKLPGQSAL